MKCGRLPQVMANTSAGALKSKCSIIGIWGLKDLVATAKRRLLEAGDVLRHGRRAHFEENRCARRVRCCGLSRLRQRPSRGAAPQRRNSAAGAKSNIFQEMSNF